MTLIRKMFFAMAAVALVFTCGFTGEASAQSVKKYAVLKFNYIGPDKYQHYGVGFQSQFRAKLTIPGTLEPVADSVVASSGATIPQSATDAYNSLIGLGADYLVWGTVTIAGNMGTLEVSMQDDKGNTLTKRAEVAREQLSMEGERLARQLQQDLFATEDQAKRQEQAANSNAQNLNSDFLSASGGAGTDPAQALNPNFRYEGGANTEGRWRSQGFPFASRSWAIGDVTGDGNNEIVILTKSKLVVMRYRDQLLEVLGEEDLSSRSEPLKVSLMDMNKDGASEIITAIFRDDRPKSKIYSFKTGKFNLLADNIGKYLNVVRMPPTYSPVLIGQGRGQPGLFKENGIYEMFFTGDDVTEGKNLRMPSGTNVFNFIYLPEGNGHKIVMINQFNRVKTYASDGSIQAESEETYNSSAIDLEVEDRLAGSGPSNGNYYSTWYYIPIPMKAISLFEKGKYEVLLNKDISVASQVFARFKTFTQGELHAMFWDGVGLNLSWKTRRIKGTVVDYDIADLNNDGRNELCVLVNTYPGAISLKNRKTIVLTYELNNAQEPQ